MRRDDVSAKMQGLSSFDEVEAAEEGTRQAHFLKLTLARL
jgi:hypothetical protein